MYLYEERSRISAAYRHAIRAGFRPVKRTREPDVNTEGVTHHAVHMKRGNETLKIYLNSRDRNTTGSGGAIYNSGDGAKDQHFGFDGTRMLLSPFVKMGGIADFRALMRKPQ